MAAVYDDIAEHFSSTRYKPWRGVRAFLGDTAAVPAGSTILEIGCGNGKNLGERAVGPSPCIVHGCDPCAALVEIAKAKNPAAELVVADGRALPYSDSSMNVVMAIAVLHHLETHADRRQFIAEAARVWNGKGSGLVTVWAPSAVKPSWRPGPAPGDYLVPWHHTSGQVYERYYHVFERDEVADLFEGLIPVKEITFEMDNWYVYF